MKGPDGRRMMTLFEKELRVVKVIGRGASSTVAKAFHPGINRFVALKKMNHMEKTQRTQILKDLQVGI